jgi:hypothetical protein
VQARRSPTTRACWKSCPWIPVTLTGVPEESQRALFDAFALVLQYDQFRSEVQVSVTVTDRLAQAIRPTPDLEGDAPEGAVMLPSALLLTPTLPSGGGRTRALAVAPVGPRP